jgi:hypothetical protein
MAPNRYPSAALPRAVKQYHGLPMIVMVTNPIDVLNYHASNFARCVPSGIVTGRNLDSAALPRPSLPGIERLVGTFLPWSGAVTETAWYHCLGYDWRWRSVTELIPQGPPESHCRSHPERRGRNRGAVEDRKRLLCPGGGHRGYGGVGAPGLPAAPALFGLSYRPVWHQRHLYRLPLYSGRRGSRVHSGVGIDRRGARSPQPVRQVYREKIICCRGILPGRELS